MEHEIGGACSTHGIDELPNLHEILVGKHSVKRQLGIHGIILKWVLKK
jgi:hypothetical protein